MVDAQFLTSISNFLDLCSHTGPVSAHENKGLYYIMLILASRYISNVYFSVQLFIGPSTPPSGARHPNAIDNSAAPEYRRNILLIVEVCFTIYLSVLFMHVLLLLSGNISATFAPPLALLSHLFYPSSNIVDSVQF